MAFFPISPVNGQQANVGNITYQFNSSANAWNRVGTTVTQLIDGITVNITGNINATGTGQQTFAGRISSGGNIAATGNLFGAHVIASGSITAVGNIEGGNFSAASGTVTTSLLNVATQLTVGSATFTPTQLSTYNVAASNAVTAPYGALTTVISSNVVTTNINSATGLFTSLLTATAGANVTGNVNTGNLNTTGNVNVTGNVSGTYILGNGALLTGVVTGGGGAGNRANVSITTTSIANAAYYTGSVTLAKGYTIYKITTSAASWIRVYTNAAARTSDATRSQTTDPQPGAGVIAEAITTGANVVLMSPATIGFNDESPVSNTIPIAVTNLSGSTGTITVTFTYLGLEL
jgi:hypothetical protein